MAAGSRGLLVHATVNQTAQVISIQSDPLLNFFAAGWPHCSKSSVVGEVFPEGGGVVRRIVPLQREAETYAAGGRLQALVEDTLGPPHTGKSLCPQGRTGARISNSPCRFV